MSDEFKNYVGHLMGVQDKSQGTSAKGKEWKSYDVLLHHGDMTKPIRFTWFDNPKLDIKSLIANNVYRVTYVEDHFTVNNEARKSKKAVKINPSTETENMGYQQSTTSASQTTQTAPNQGVIQQQVLTPSENNNALNQPFTPPNAINPVNAPQSINQVQGTVSPPNMQGTETVIKEFKARYIREVPLEKHTADHFVLTLLVETGVINVDKVKQLKQVFNSNDR